MGFIAEEVGEVIPEAVTYEEDGTYAYAMSYNHISPVLVEAVKEQQVLIEKQHQRIDELQRKLNDLESNVLR